MHGHTNIKSYSVGQLVKSPQINVVMWLVERLTEVENVARKFTLTGCGELNKLVAAVCVTWKLRLNYIFVKVLVLAFILTQCFTPLK